MWLLHALLQHKAEAEAEAEAEAVGKAEAAPQAVVGPRTVAVREAAPRRGRRRVHHRCRRP